jgi:hypothetical protein
MNFLRALIVGVTDECVWKRIGWMYASFFLLLIPVFVLSNFLLPEGILRGKHPIIKALELSPVLWISTLQIFGYNLIFSSLVIGANIFARKSRVCPERFIPLGYLAFWGLPVTIALYMWTWSQDVVTVAPPLHQRFLRLFDIVNRGGFWELSGYLLLASTSFKFTLHYIDGKREVAGKSWRDVSMTASEKILLALAFVFVLCGALIESYGIIALAG